MSSVVVLVAVRCGDGDDDLLRVGLIRDGSVIRWRDVTPPAGMRPWSGPWRESLIEGVFAMGGSVMLVDGDDEDVLPAWFYRVDLVELGDEVLAAMARGRATGRAPLFEMVD